MVLLAIIRRKSVCEILLYQRLKIEVNIKERSNVRFAPSFVCVLFNIVNKKK